MPRAPAFVLVGLLAVPAAWRSRKTFLLTGTWTGSAELGRRDRFGGVGASGEWRCDRRFRIVHPRSRDGSRRT